MEPAGAMLNCVEKG